MTVPGLSRLVFVVVLLAIAGMVGGIGISNASRHELTFYYFNPDSYNSNLGRLKKEMDELFRQHDLPVNFQPFARLSDFHRQIQNRRPVFCFLPSWYLEQYGAELGLKAQLIPRRGNKTTYRKILLVKRGSGYDSRAVLPQVPLTLAMTTMGPETENFIDQAVFSRLSVKPDRYDIVYVPKDADALFALALGQVDMALVASNNLEIISELSPRLVASVTPLIETRPIRMPVLCFTEAADEVSDQQLDRVMKLLMEPPSEKQRQQYMEMLNIDGWQKIQ